MCKQNHELSWLCCVAVAFCKVFCLVFLCSLNVTCAAERYVSSSLLRSENHFLITLSYLDAHKYFYSDKQFQSQDPYLTYFMRLFSPPPR